MKCDRDEEHLLDPVAQSDRGLVSSPQVASLGTFPFQLFSPTVITIEPREEFPMRSGLGSVEAYANSSSVTNGATAITSGAGGWFKSNVCQSAELGEGAVSGFSAVYARGYVTMNHQQQ